MGLFDFFHNRRERESALPASQSPAEPESEPQSQSQSLGSFADPDGRQVVGRQVAGGPTAGPVEVANLGDAIEALTQIGPMFQRAMTEGSPQVTIGEANTIDLRGTELSEQIREIMRRHGIDPETGQADPDTDPSSYAGMQQEILAALSGHGIDTGVAGKLLDSSGEQPKSDPAG